MTGPVDAVINDVESDDDDLFGLNYCTENSDGICVFNEEGELPWEECMMLPNCEYEEYEEKLKALNNLLKDGFFIYSTTVVGDSLFIRLRSINPVEV